MEIKACNLVFEGEGWDEYGDDVKQFVASMICPVSKRRTVRQVFEDPIINDLIATEYTLP